MSDASDGKSSMGPTESVEDRLSRLARATEGVRARRDFGARVMGAIEQDKGSPLFAGVLSTWRRAVIPAALAAVFGLGLAAFGESDANEDMAASYTAVDAELDW
jgi:hypothetical protein